MEKSGLRINMQKANFMKAKTQDKVQIEGMDTEDDDKFTSLPNAKFKYIFNFTLKSLLHYGMCGGDTNMQLQQMPQYIMAW